MQIPPGLGECLQACRDIHTVAEDVVFLNDHVAQVDADAKLDPLGGRDGRIALGHAALHIHRAAHRINHAGEVG